MKYPTKWKRTTMRGCGPQCRQMALLVESRQVSATELETRHVIKAEPRWLERCQG
jgi:hypothetical protein